MADVSTSGGGHQAPGISMNGILLFNPRSANAKYRVPNSILNIAASVEGVYAWVIVDGNREMDPYDENNAVTWKQVSLNMLALL